MAGWCGGDAVLRGDVVSQRLQSELESGGELLDRVARHVGHLERKTSTSLVVGPATHEACDGVASSLP